MEDRDEDDNWIACGTADCTRQALPCDSSPEGLCEVHHLECHPGAFDRLARKYADATFCHRCGESLETHGDEEDCRERREQDARDFHELLTKPQEQVDADLRSFGYDPEKVAEHGRVFIDTCLKCGIPAAS